MRKSWQKQNGGISTLQRFTLSKKLGSAINPVGKQTHSPRSLKSCCLKRQQGDMPGLFLETEYRITYCLWVTINLQKSMLSKAADFHYQLVLCMLSFNNPAGIIDFFFF